MFDLQKTTSIGRRGVLHTSRGSIETPFFMPVGTAGAMKGLSHDDLLDLGAQILLCNTYHLHLRPGEDVVEEAGGLHDFVYWNKPILTDSGGYQVFSLRHRNRATDEGVTFRSHIDGASLFLGPSEAMHIQHALGADMIMCFDECPPSTAARWEIEVAVDRTLVWAAECKRVHEELKAKSNNEGPLLFGIVQGGLHEDLRKKCAEELIAIGFDGYAIGGLAVGEATEDMYRVLDIVCPLLPEEKPRYLMGVGVIEQLQTAVQKGIDMFDCVHPMRIARHATLLLSDGSRIDIKNAQYERDYSAIDSSSPSEWSQQHSKSFLRHLFKAQERYAESIAAKQNLGVTLKAMQVLRAEMDTLD